MYNYLFSENNTRNYEAPWLNSSLPWLEMLDKWDQNSNYSNWNVTNLKYWIEAYQQFLTEISPTANDLVGNLNEYNSIVNSSSTETYTFIFEDTNNSHSRPDFETLILKEVYQYNLPVNYST